MPDVTGSYLYMFGSGHWLATVKGEEHSLHVQRQVFVGFVF